MTSPKRLPLMQTSLVALLAAGSLAATGPAAPRAHAQVADCPQVSPTGGPVIEAQQPPPPLPDEAQPPIPAPGYLWTPGYWYWNNADYYYVPGVWAQPPQPGLLWTPGFWGFVGGAYLFTHGYWGPHVGFYGGIPYGHGYDGTGYLGGRWQGGNFFYNRTVNNFGGVHITNVYNENVNRFDGPRVSFNGGPGGLDVRPTPGQLAFMRDRHDAPTPLQMQNLRAAGMVPGSFAAINHGHPELDALRSNIHQAADRLPEPVHPGPGGFGPHPAGVPPNPGMIHPPEGPHPEPGGPIEHPQIDRQMAPIGHPAGQPFERPEQHIAPPPRAPEHFEAQQQRFVPPPPPRPAPHEIPREFPHPVPHPVPHPDPHGEHEPPRP